ncbi:hypothetical protein NH340_JMT00232 [Sarcoptes scabiei]|nr:hypothetical protein NH340_JMT00232 [Sarcoptes scabiei]
MEEEKKEKKRMQITSLILTFFTINAWPRLRCNVSTNSKPHSISDVERVKNKTKANKRSKSNGWLVGDEDGLILFSNNLSRQSDYVHSKLWSVLV